MQLEIEAVQNELINTKHEFETYKVSAKLSAVYLCLDIIDCLKVRVHNVLKNNRHSAEEDSWTYEK